MRRCSEKPYRRHTKCRRRRWFDPTRELQQTREEMRSRLWASLRGLGRHGSVRGRFIREEDAVSLKCSSHTRRRKTGQHTGSYHHSITWQSSVACSLTPFVLFRLLPLKHGHLRRSTWLVQSLIQGWWVPASKEGSLRSNAHVRPKVLISRCSLTVSTIALMPITCTTGVAGSHVLNAILTCIWQPTFATFKIRGLFAIYTRCRTSSLQWSLSEVHRQAWHFFHESESGISWYLMKLLWVVMWRSAMHAQVGPVVQFNVLLIRGPLAARPQLWMSFQFGPGTS